MLAHHITAYTASVYGAYRSKDDSSFTSTNKTATAPKTLGAVVLCDVCWLSTCVHIVVVALIVARGDVVEPCLVIQVPAYGLLDALLEL